jgi:hypothetical protein
VDILFMELLEQFGVIEKFIRNKGLKWIK